ncbi:glutamine-hydrolyzing GMP synthase [Candidatus Woesearchaeota archaeon]|nr:glutamine-hydrolyzing GMP synthase [Candidatus Woesearchaeota archaeon]
MILIIDFGSQVSHLIARRIRQLGVYSELVHWTEPVESIKSMMPEGIILSGGPRSVYEKDAPTISPGVLKLGIPVLGICYGHQLVAHLTGSRVVSSSKEYGREMMSIKKPSQLLKGMKRKEQVWMSHGDSVTELKPGFELLASTPDCKVAAYANEPAKIFGVQFHPEVQHTLNGIRILDNFLRICKAKRNYSAKGIGTRLAEEAKSRIGSMGVIMAVSGGVDSLVAATIIRKATRNIHLVFVDNGLLRKNEAEQVRKTFHELEFENFHFIDASELFLKRLKGVVEPEQKRKVIGHTFIDVFERKAAELKKRHGDIEFLGQGTIYPDRIESAQPSKTASLIKTHHNVGGLPEKMKLKTVEPLRDLYKDEVRALGRSMGISEELLERHPFPGPGLAIRVIGEVTNEKLKILREADFIFIEQLKKHGFYKKTWQALAALLPVKAVGVMGDERTYSYIIALRAVTSSDAMTADWAKLPYTLLERASSDIVKNVKGVNRVLYDITQKPPATIEYE